MPKSHSCVCLTKVTPGANADSFSSMLSNAGNEIVFTSSANNLVAGDTNTFTDIFARGIFPLSAVRRYSVDSFGNQSGGPFGNSGNPAVAGEGKVVVYETNANNLISNDTNVKSDVFETLSRGPFKRGDANGNGTVEQITDGVYLNNFLFLGGPPPPCLDAADANDNGQLNLTDSLVIFNQGPFPPPGATNCGNENTGDALTCCVHPCQ